MHYKKLDLVECIPGAKFKDIQAINKICNRNVLRSRIYNAIRDLSPTEISNNISYGAKDLIRKDIEDIPGRIGVDIERIHCMCMYGCRQG
jgi:hypothetical protein